MGAPGLWAYGEIDMGSAIETAKTKIAKIETNKFDNTDIAELVKAISDIAIATINYKHSRGYFRYLGLLAKNS